MKNIIVLTVFVLCLAACNQKDTGQGPQANSKEASAKASQGSKSTASTKQDLIFDYLNLAIPESNKVVDARDNTRAKLAKLKGGLSPEGQRKNSEQTVQFLKDEKAQLLQSKQKMSIATVPDGCEKAQQAHLEFYELQEEFLDLSIAAFQKDVDEGSIDLEKFELAQKNLSRAAAKSAELAGEHDKIARAHNLR